MERSEFLEDMTVRKGLKEMLVPPGAGLVTTAFAQLRWSGFLWPGGEAFSFSGLLQRPPGPAKEDDDEESSDDGEQEVALEATDCARLALAIPATLRTSRPLDRSWGGIGSVEHRSFDGRCQCYRGSMGNLHVRRCVGR